jgi:hypothetical protein
LQLNLPPAPVRDLIVKDDDLVVATHGRAFWILDDITPLRQMPVDSQPDVYLFKPRVAWRSHASGGFPVHGPYGQNPPGGAIIDYYLKAEPGPKDNLKLEILDSQGKLVRSFSSKKRKESESRLQSEFPRSRGELQTLPAKAGANRFVWDLRYKGPDPVPHHISWGEVRGGPMVLPGTYQIKLTEGGKALTEPLTVKLAPIIKASQADLEKQLKLALQIRDSITQAHDVVNDIQSLHSQIQSLEHRLKGNAQVKDLLDAADRLDKKMKVVEEALIQVKTQSSEDNLNFPIMISGKLGALYGAVESADAAPTAASYTVCQLLSKQLDAQLRKWKDIETKDLEALNALARQSNIALLAIPSPAARDL